jgi:gliding motility-associated-like protein
MGIRFSSICIRVVLSVFVFGIGCFPTIASDPKWTGSLNDAKGFVENKGQYDYFKDVYGIDGVKFVYDGGFEKFVFTEKGLTIVLSDRQQIEKTEEIRKKREERKKQGFKEGEWQQFEREGRKITITNEIVHAIWLNSSPDCKINPESKNSFYHNFMQKDEASAKTVSHVSSFRKLVYKNLYPGINAVYELHPQGGVKYSLELSAGANSDLIQLSYSHPLSLDNNGSLFIHTQFGNITEHAPLTYHKSNQKNVVSSNFRLTNNVIQFDLGAYDNHQDIVIDPWIQTPSFPTNWDCIWECDRDGAGNVYAIGGVMPLTLLKYDSNGALQWTFNTPYDTTTWLGTMATDITGNAYVANGTSPGIIKVSPAGVLVWNNPNPGGFFSNTEFWKIKFNCDHSKMLVGGTGGVLLPLPFIYEVNMNTGAILSQNQFSMPSGGAVIEEVRALTFAENGMFAFLTHAFYGYIHETISSCSPNSGTPPFVTLSGSTMGYKGENFRKNNTGLEAIKYHEGYIYYNRGNQLQKRLFNDGSVVATATIPGGVYNVSALAGNTVGNSGIDIDSCGNIYVGSVNGVHRFDQNLNLVGSFTTAFNVYDVHVNVNGDIIACGSTGTSSTAIRTGSVQVFSASACQAVILQSCCDATVCNVPFQCVDDAPFQLTALTPGGTFSGNGVTSTGLFDPSTAGVGVHVITYTIPCGSDSIIITVNSCTPLDVCIEPDGTLTVNGGTGPYIWEQFIPASSTPITNQAECVACGFTWLFGTCLNGIVAVTSCNTPAAWINFGNGTNVNAPTFFPARVTDNSGTVFQINSLADLLPCISCPSIFISIDSLFNTTCGINPGSAYLSATGGNAPYTFVWQPGNITGSAQTNLAFGQYNVTVTDASNCTSNITISISPSVGIQLVSMEVTPSNCNSNDGAVFVQVAGPTSNYTFDLYDSNGLIATLSGTSLSQNFTGLGSGIYTVDVTSAQNCTLNLQVNVPTLNGQVIDTLIVTNQGCLNDDGAIQVVISGGTADYNYQLSSTSGTANIVSSDTTITFSGLTVGTYLVTVLDSNNCAASAQAIVSQTPSPLIDSAMVVNAGCGLNNGTITVFISSGTGPFEYRLIQNGNLLNTVNSASTQQQFIALFAGDYLVQVTDVNGCVTTATYTIINPSAPVIDNVQTTQPICFGENTGNISLSVSGGTTPLTYAWNPPVSVGPAANNLAPGVYSIIITDANSCSVTTTISLNQPSPIIGDIFNSPSVCSQPNGTASVSANGGSGPLTIEWNTGAASSTIINLLPGTYSVLVSDSLGCSILLATTVGTTGFFTIDAGFDAEIELGESVTLVGSGPANANYLWTPSGSLDCADCLTATATPDETTWYVLTANQNGCVVSDSVLITVKEICGDVFLPTAFSPNNDGFNDVFRVRGNCIVELEFQVYSRWGELLYSTTDKNQGWDGTYKGQLLAGGVYTWVVNAVLKGSVVTKAGNVTLIRD